jgi:hypothetical protein
LVRKNTLSKEVKKKVANIGWVLDPETIATLKACLECKENPAVFLTAKKVPCCRMCWEKLAVCFVWTFQRWQLRRLNEIGTKLNASAPTLEYAEQILQLAIEQRLTSGQSPRVLDAVSLYIGQFRGWVKKVYF